jgi:hypothetical protein
MAIQTSSIPPTTRSVKPTTQQIPSTNICEDFSYFFERINPTLLELGRHTPSAKICEDFDYFLKKIDPILLKLAKDPIPWYVEAEISIRTYTPPTYDPPRKIEKPEKIVPYNIYAGRRCPHGESFHSAEGYCGTCEMNIRRGMI